MLTQPSNTHVASAEQQESPPSNQNQNQGNIRIDLSKISDKSLPLPLSRTNSADLHSAEKLSQKRLQDQQAFQSFNQDFDQTYGVNSTNVISHVKKAQEAGNLSKNTSLILNESSRNELLVQWRHHFISKVKAHKTENHAEKMSHLRESLTQLKIIQNPNKNLFTSLLMCHSKALIYYEMGVL